MTETARPRLTPWVVAGLGWAYYMTPFLVPLVQPGHPWDAWLLVREAVPGLLAIAYLRWRVRTPVGVAFAVAGLWVLSSAVIGAALVAQENLARRHRGRYVIPAVAGVMIVAKGINAWLLAPAGAALTARWFETGLAVVGVIIATLVGLLRSSRGEASDSRSQAELARAEAELARLAEARLAERELIAREMHDAVAHRLSLVALHAGALAYRTDLTPEETREAARGIQGNAQASLDELRTMLATLRGADAPPEAPQPSLDQLDVLLADAEDAGQHVALERVGDLRAVPERVSRHAFRIVQECLTNARKHAPGASTTVLVALDGGVLRVRAANALADLAPRNTSGAGLGLVGVAERVAILGGTLTHGVQRREFVVDAALPLGIAPTEGRP